FETSSWEDLFQYLLIVIVIFGLSPYGIFFLKCVIAWRQGTAPPRLHRGKSGQVNHIRSVVDQANRHIEDASVRIFELEAELSESLSVIDGLELENEALRERIRILDSARDTHDQTFSGHRARSNASVPEEIVAALSLFWLSADPLPEWADIRQAYRNAVKLHHPDRGGDPETIKKMNVAYDLLKTYYKD
ncbi:unnamed protein product, partial [Laminaria digitata]